MTLLPHHAKLLTDSSIATDVAGERGYWSAETKAELSRLGFGRDQLRVPTLVMPIRDVHGEIATYLSRPDMPRITDGRPLKYEIPAGSRMVLDVPMRARKDLRDPGRPLWITEGARKADAALSIGLTCVSLVGVWCWRGTNERGGKTALTDWESIALNGREVYVVFDSDVMVKAGVHSALARFKPFLEQRGARVRLVYLPPGEGGTKVGLDDYIADGRGVEDLLALATTELRRLESDEPAHPYEETRHGIVWHKPARGGTEEVALTNFTARITADVTRDDGADTERIFELEAELGGRRIDFSVPADRFASMQWPTEEIGAGARVAPGLGAKDHARYAIQLLSGDPPRRTSYGHLGWRKIGEAWLYLHAGGAIGAEGAVEEIDTHATGPLERFELPEPREGEALAEAVRASLALLEVAPYRVTVPLLAAVGRAPLSDSDFSLHLAGPTGVRKTALAAVFQQHWGSALHARNLAESWQSTPNAIEVLLFATKDTLVVVDEFQPGGSAAGVDKAHRDADRVFRAQGNQAGRGRLRADASMKPVKHPRGVIVSTGEDVPRGSSLRARMMIIEVERGVVDLERLGAAQQVADQGVLAQSLAGYLHFLARREGAKTERAAEFERLRDRARGGPHGRTAEIVANLMLGFNSFIAFAVGAEAIPRSKGDELGGLAWSALLEGSAAQARQQRGQEPARRFLDLLTGAIASGAAHVTARDGSNPRHAGAWGWQNDGQEERPRGARVGWLDEEQLYLEPEASFAAVQRLGQASGDALGVSPETLRKRLHEAGHLVRTDLATKRQTITVRVRLDGKRREVLHLSAETLLPDQDPSTEAERPDQPESDGCAPRSGPPRDPTSSPTTREPGGDPEGGGSGRGGRVKKEEGPALERECSQETPEMPGATSSLATRGDETEPDHPDHTEAGDGSAPVGVEG